jgi:hypothetical protein
MAACVAEQNDSINNWMICIHSAWSAAAAPVLFVWMMFYNRAGSR